jgi:hypothetical protein
MADMAIETVIFTMISMTHGSAKEGIGVSTLGIPILRLGAFAKTGHGQMAPCFTIHIVANPTTHFTIHFFCSPATIIPDLHTFPEDAPTLRPQSPTPAPTPSEELRPVPIKTTAITTPATTPSEELRPVPIKTTAITSPATTTGLLLLLPLPIKEAAVAVAEV